MIRAAELALFLSPVVIYVLWRRAASSGKMLPGRGALITLFAGLAILGAGLAWTGLHERHAEGSQYVPAQFQDGQVVPGHGIEAADLERSGAWRRARRVATGASRGRVRA